MNWIIHSVLIAVIAVPALAEGKGELRGCKTPSDLVVGLRKVLGPNWSTTSLEQIQKDWSSALEAANCANGSCRSVRRDGRIISGKYECGEQIDLDLPTASQNSRS